MPNHLNNQDGKDKLFEDDCYFYEYAIKKPGQAYIGFIVIIDSVSIRKVDYTLLIKDEQIIKVNKQSDTIYREVSINKLHNGNIYIMKHNLLCYSSVNLKNRETFLHKNYWDQISEVFFDKKNVDKMRLIQDFVEKRIY
jgi:hypothetical protein